MPNARRTRPAPVDGRRPRLALAALLAAAACAPDRGPTAAEGVATSARAGVSAASTSSDQLVQLTRDLFVADEDAALVDVRQLLHYPRNGPDACRLVGRIFLRTFADYRTYALAGQKQGDTTTLTLPRPKVQQYVRLLGGRCDRIAPENGIPDGALDVNGAVGLVPRDSTVSIETVPGPEGQAGVRVRAGTFDVDVLLYILPRPDGLSLPTTLPQYRPRYEVFVEPAQPTPYRQRVDLGFVVNWPDGPPSDHLVIGHAVTPDSLEVLQPIYLTTPAAAAGVFGGPAYLRPLGGPQTARSAPSLGASVAPSEQFGVLAAVVKGTSTNHGGQADSFSPFALVPVFQTGVNPNRAVTLGTGVCSRAGAAAVPYTVNTTTDIVLNYQPLDGAGNAITGRTLLLLRGIGSGPPRDASLPVPSATRRVRFFFGGTLFATRTVPACD